MTDPVCSPQLNVTFIKKKFLGDALSSFLKIGIMNRGNFVLMLNISSQVREVKKGAPSEKVLQTTFLDHFSPQSNMYYCKIGSSCRMFAVPNITFNHLCFAVSPLLQIIPALFAYTLIVIISA